MTKPLTMALRLFGNILAGEILLIVLYQLAPWVVPELWVMFSLFIGFVQAFIFTICLWAAMHWHLLATTNTKLFKQKI